MDAGAGKRERAGSGHVVDASRGILASVCKLGNGSSDLHVCSGKEIVALSCVYGSHSPALCWLGEVGHPNCQGQVMGRPT
jgi:hypothetical protein